MARTKKHKKYYLIPAYQKIARKSDEEMASILGISVRTYREKISGYYDFTASQGIVLSNILGETQDKLFTV